MRGTILGGGFAAFVFITLACGPKPPPPEPAAEPQPTEVQEDRAELADSQQDLQDDRVDLAKLNDIVEDWHRARKNDNRALERQADDRLARWIRQELAEDVGEVQESREEAHRSATDDDATRPGDDKRDAADDRRDAQAAKGEAARTRAIARELRQIQPRFDNGTAQAPLYSQKSELLRELQGIARRELQRSKEERAEDVQEVREDTRGGQGAAASSSGGGQQAAASSGGAGGKKPAQQDDDAEERIGAKKLIAAINKWVAGRADGDAAQVKAANKRIMLWAKQEVARQQPWTPRSGEIAVALRRIQKKINNGEATPQTYERKRELLIELRKIAKARVEANK